MHQIWCIFKFCYKPIISQVVITVKISKLPSKFESVPLVAHFGGLLLLRKANLSISFYLSATNAVTTYVYFSMNSLNHIT